jgi:hypothetical protein
MKRGYAAQFDERFTRFRRAKIPTPVAPLAGFPLRSIKLRGISEFFTKALRAAAPHFRLKGVLFFDLNSSHAASRRRAIALATVHSGEFIFKDDTKIGIFLSQTEHII